MNTKAKGSRNERKSKKLFEKAGYGCCKAGASLGAWDVIGVRSADVILCQVKSNRWPSKAELKKLKAFPAPANVHKLVHCWRDGQGWPDVKEL